MKRRIRPKKACFKCGAEEGTRYAYSINLSNLLHLRPNEGVYLCKPCFDALNEEFKTNSLPSLLEEMGLL
jgi:hypothetical protein